MRLCGASSMNSCALTSWEMMTLCPRSTCNARHCRQEEWSSLPSTAFTAGWSRPGFSKIIIFSGSRVDQASNITCHRVGDCFSGGVAGPSPNAHLWGSHGRATPPRFHKKTPGERQKAITKARSSEGGAAKGPAKQSGPAKRGGPLKGSETKGDATQGQYPTHHTQHTYCVSSLLLWSSLFFP